jgi:hypothetical protein
VQAATIFFSEALSALNIEIGVSYFVFPFRDVTTNPVSIWGKDNLETKNRFRVEFGKGD